MNKIIKYSKSNDGIGLVAHFNDGTTYHVHKDEMSELEQWIFTMFGDSGYCRYLKCDFADKCEGSCSAVKDYF